MKQSPFEIGTQRTQSLHKAHNVFLCETLHRGGDTNNAAAKLIPGVLAGIETLQDELPLRIGWVQ